MDGRQDVDPPMRRGRTVIDEETGLPITPRVRGSARTHDFDPGTLDGSQVEWNVVRQRRTTGRDRGSSR